MNEVKHVTKLADLVQIISENKNTAIKFSTAWCGPCKVYGPQFEKYAAEFPDAVFVSVDLTEDAEISAQFGITNIPTTVFTKDGKEAVRHMGILPKAKFTENL